MSERGFDLKRGLLGIALFALGAFFAILGGMALWKQEPLGEATGSGALADVWLRSIGALPGLVFSGGVAVLGARLWLAGRVENLLRHVFAFASLALALSVLCGALTAEGGGRLGFATGGLIAENLHPLAGIAVGLIAVAASVWFGWLRRAHVESAVRPQVRAPDAGADLDDGVSAAEAAALFPEDFHRAFDPGRKHLARDAPLSPYPEDVRLRGEIPAGARPLHSPSQDVRPEPEGAPQPEPLRRWTAARPDPAVAARADLALELHDDEQAEAAPEALAVADEPAQAAELRPPATPEREQVPEVQPLAPLPRPSWEQSNLFTEDEEAVDAYGTPLSLVEALRRSQQEVAEAFESEPEAFPITGEVALDGARGLEALELEEEEDETDELEAEDLEEGFEEETLDEEDAELEGDAELEHEEAGSGDRELMPALPPPRRVAGTVASSAVSPADPERSERDMVLTPYAATPIDPGAQAAARGAGRAQLLAEVGCLFLDRGRVAVSMLQRQYGMDFEAACRMLDELQELGLIGPYLGGQRRDILLTREQWLERVTGV